MNNYLKINTPQELLEFMSKNIFYGYLGKSGRVYQYNDPDFNSRWENEYVLEDANEVLKNKVGNCWDQVEFERSWFLSHNYEIKTFFEIVNLDYPNDYPSHSFLAYKENDKWYWFENADYNNQGIHSFNSLDELIDFEYQKYLELLHSFNIKEEEIKNIILKEFDKPKSNISFKEYLEHVLNSEVRCISK